jgi:hypothetical protein
MKSRPMTILRQILLYAFLLVVAPFLILEVAFRLLPVRTTPPLLPVTAENPVPRFQPNVEYDYSADWNFAITTRKRTNNFGYNHVADYRPAASTPLLTVIGDSFVEAYQVDAGKSAPELLNAALGAEGRVYSIGLSGAPLSQYLVFAQFARDTLRPDAMAFVIIGNDFDESLLKYKAEPRFHYFAETAHGPVLRRIDYQLSPAKKILRHSAFLRYVVHNVAAELRIDGLRRANRPVDQSAEAMETRIRDSQRAVDWFLDLLPEKSGLASGSILLVLDALRPGIYSAAALEAAEQGYHGRLRRYLAQEARARGYEVLDMQPVFLSRHRADKSRFEFPTDSHWNELGHAVVADEMRKSAVFQRVFGAPGMTQVRLRAAPAPR